ncbi:MAG: hypothetical protein QOK40_2749 [Miltoncostaeaceae bacterium]|nr:hypothetical protein [Miltoncostaeaceae bacterium]
MRNGGQDRGPVGARRGDQIGAPAPPASAPNEPPSGGRSAEGVELLNVIQDVYLTSRSGLPGAESGQAAGWPPAGPNGGATRPRSPRGHMTAAPAAKLAA